MDDKAKRGGAIVTLALVVVLALLPLIYVLSIGPVARMLEDGWISRSWEPTLEHAYFPVIWTADNVPAVESVATSYMRLWMRPYQTVTAAPPVPVPATALPPASTPTVSSIDQQPTATNPPPE